jgi:hypothetical protein
MAKEDVYIVNTDVLLGKPDLSKGTYGQFDTPKSWKDYYRGEEVDFSDEPDRGRALYEAGALLKPGEEAPPAVQPTLGTTPVDNPDTGGKSTATAMAEESATKAAPTKTTG